MVKCRGEVFQEVLWRTGVEKRRRDVLWRSVVEKCCTEVL